MPYITLPTGELKYIPRVYFSTKIASNLPGPLPAFQIPVIMGSAGQGHPYNADSLVFTSETKPGGFKFFGTADAVGDYYGRGSDVHRAFVWAQRHGLPGGWVSSLSALTRATVIVDTASVNQATLFARSFGAPGGWIKVSYAANVLTVQGLKNFAFFSANISSSATRINLKGETSWIVEGGTYQVGDNTTAIGPITVRRKGRELDANGQWQDFIETTVAFGSALTTANYAMIAEYDVANQEVYSNVTTSQELIDRLAVSVYVGAHKHAAFTNGVPDTVASLTPIKQIVAWVTATPGTSPAAASGDITAWISYMNATGWEDFLLKYGVIPQAYYLAMGDSASHLLFRDYTIAQRRNKFGISLTTGVRWGDTVVASGTDTDPKFRTAALNSQDVTLCGPGLDREAPYLSLGAAVFGLRVSGGPGHNLTNDDLIFSELEDRWDELNLGELTTLLRAGFCTVKLSEGRTIRYRIAQGINTLQANVVLWNPATKDTWSIMQRDLADFVDRVMFVDLEEDIIGADAINPSVLARVLRLRSEKTLIPSGFVVEHTITSITLDASGAGWVVKQSLRLPTPSDYVLLENTILIG